MNCVQPRRRGAMLILIVVMLTVFAVSAAITVDYAYMGLVRTELQIATDAAAKAGAEALARGETSDAAKQAAVQYAALNFVGGESLQIRTDDVSVGRLLWNDDGSWQFANQSPVNAVRVDSRTGGDALHPAIPLFFGRILGTDNFSPRCTSTAGQQNVAICLCIDRSGTMLLDMSGNTDLDAFPPDNPLLSDYPAPTERVRQQISPPNPVGSRWAAARGAIDLFLDEVSLHTPPPRTGLVTWASDYSRTAPTLQFQAATIDLEVPPLGEGNWNSNRAHLDREIRRLSRQPMMGDTELSTGLERAIEALGTPEAGAAAHKVIILMTDGIRSDHHRDPLATAAQASAAGITVHTVTMLTGAQQELEDIATLTGGRHFMTQNEAELRTAFQELARSLPVVLVE